MKNAELRNLVPVDPVRKAPGNGPLLAQCALVFALAVGGVALYRNPSLAKGWIPGLGASNPAVGAAAVPPAKLPPAALAAIADEKAGDGDTPLTMMDEQVAASVEMAADATTWNDPNPDPRKKEFAKKLYGAGTAHIGGVMKMAELFNGQPSILNVKIYAGGATSRAMAKSCLEAGAGVDFKADAIAKAANCFMTTNVERLCSGAQRQVLADMVNHYYAMRDFWLDKNADAAKGGRPVNPDHPKPAEWTAPAHKAVPTNLARLVAQGYLTRDVFGWAPNDDIKAVVNTKPVERDACAGQKS